LLRAVCLKHTDTIYRLLEVETQWDRPARSYPLGDQPVIDIAVLRKHLVVVALEREVIIVKNLEGEIRLPAPGAVLWLRRIRGEVVIGVRAASERATSRYSVWIMGVSRKIREVWSSGSARPFDVHAGGNGTIELSTMDGDILRYERVSTSRR